MASRPKTVEQATDEPMPSPEELLALVEMLQQQGMNMDQVPPDLKTMLDNVKRQKAVKGGAAAPPDVPTEEITPDPGFVVKTGNVESGEKVFINVCSCNRVAAPGGWEGGVIPDEVAAALEKLQSPNADTAAASMSPGEVEALRFPLSCGQPRADTDRKGSPCTVIDVVFNSDVVRAAAAERRLKTLLIEVALGWVSKKLGAQLDERFKLPRMRYKGEVVASQRIRADDKRKKLVTELRDVDEEPAFALRTRKAPRAADNTPGSSTAGAATEQGPSSSNNGGGERVQAGGGETTAAAAAPKGPAAVGTGPSTAAAAAAAGVAGGPESRTGGGVSHKVEYEGRPVEWVRVTVDLPTHASVGRSGQLPGSNPVVEVAGRSLFIRPEGPAGAEMHIPLLFAVSTEGASAVCQTTASTSSPSVGKAGASAAAAMTQLVLRLPYRSLGDYLADARAQAPLAFGQLSFASNALLELEP